MLGEARNSRDGFPECRRKNVQRWTGVSTLRYEVRARNRDEMSALEGFFEFVRVGSCSGNKWNTCGNEVAR